MDRLGRPEDQKVEGLGYKGGQGSPEISTGH